jgi:hypothetical protein
MVARAFVAAHLPGADVKGKVSGASFFAGQKVFAFTTPRGLVLKLPPEAIIELLAIRQAEHLKMGKRIMREWVLLAQAAPEGYMDELPLLKLAMHFVRSPAVKKRERR